jgi:hypothetical protein
MGCNTGGALIPTSYNEPDPRARRSGGSLRERSRMNELLPISPGKTQLGLKVHAALLQMLATEV